MFTNMNYKPDSNFKFNFDLNENPDTVASKTSSKTQDGEESSSIGRNIQKRSVSKKPIMGMKKPLMENRKEKSQKPSKMEQQFLKPIPKSQQKVLHSSQYLSKIKPSTSPLMKIPLSSDLQDMKINSRDVQDTGNRNPNKAMRNTECRFIANRDPLNLMKAQSKRCNILPLGTCTPTIDHYNEVEKCYMIETKNNNHLEMEKCESLITKKNVDPISIRSNDNETYSIIEQQVEQTIKENKIFLIRGDIPYLENILKKRGWTQKYESRRTRHLPYGSTNLLETQSLGSLRLPDGTFNEKFIIYNILKNVPPDFIWDCRNNFTEWNGHVKPDTFLNRFDKSYKYTTKLGLATVLKHTDKFVTRDVQFPRSYNVTREKNEFIENYRQTAAVSLLKYFVEQMEKGIELTNKGSSPIPLKQIEFAMKRCDEIIEISNKQDLDCLDFSISTDDWNTFIEDYIKFVHEDNGIAIDLLQHDTIYEFKPLPMLHVSAVRILNQLKSFDSQYELNGVKNIWILKPSDLCRGNGIIMSHQLSFIIKKAYEHSKDYFIVQKYIERPLLVHDTKFDVRQWFLVTNSDPLTIWIYKESFLRFSSKTFTFDTYHEIVHICNTAVQNKYMESKNSIRSQDWDYDRLNEYLKTRGYSGEPWYDEIYPKMRKAVISAMLASQDEMDRRKPTFELYGADFMITEDLLVWLIEINSNPRIYPPSTRVTERLYPDILDSLVKVVMDYPLDPNADTGGFVLEYDESTRENESSFSQQNPDVQEEASNSSSNTEID